MVVKMGPTYEALATNTIEGEFFMGSPIIVDGEIFLRGQNKLYAISNTNDQVEGLAKKRLQRWVLQSE